jgi:hypothetical protein
MLRSTLIASLMLSTVAVGVALKSTALEPRTLKSTAIAASQGDMKSTASLSASRPTLTTPVLYAQATPQQATPQTVQVERGGAQIYTQPESSSQVIGSYQAGVVLSPRLRLFNPEGQAWLRVGDHWIPEESVTLLEGEASTALPSARPIPIDLPTPASASAPPTVAPQQQPSAQQPTPAPAPSPTPAPAPQPEAAKPAVTPAPKPQVAPSPALAKPPAAAKSQAKPQPQATAKPAGSSTVVLITKDPKAQVNVRTAANTQSDVVYAGRNGDQVQVLKSQAGEGGYTWYQVKFPVAKVQGWVRGDFIKLGAK